MTSQFDARLEELRFLSEVDRLGSYDVPPSKDPTPRRQMIVSLVVDGYLNGIDTMPWLHSNDFDLDAEFERGRRDVLSRILGGVGPTYVRVSHKGRVRISELRQALKVGRGKERFGLLWE